LSRSDDTISITHAETQQVPGLLEKLILSLQTGKPLLYKPTSIIGPGGLLDIESAWDPHFEFYHANAIDRLIDPSDLPAKDLIALYDIRYLPHAILESGGAILSCINHLYDLRSFAEGWSPSRPSFSIVKDFIDDYELYAEDMNDTEYRAHEKHISVPFSSSGSSTSEKHFRPIMKIKGQKVKLPLILRKSKLSRRWAKSWVFSLVCLLKWANEEIKGIKAPSSKVDILFRLLIRLSSLPRIYGFERYMGPLAKVLNFLYAIKRSNFRV